MVASPSAKSSNPWAAACPVSASYYIIQGLFAFSMGMQLGICTVYCSFRRAKVDANLRLVSRALLAELPEE